MMYRSEPWTLEERDKKTDWTELDWAILRVKILKKNVNSTIKLSLCLIKHFSLKRGGGVEV
jgi:hypothetical protein